MGHEITVENSTNRVRVELDGVLLADTQAPRLLRETGYPVRYYLPRADVRTDLLAPSETTTHCPFKGDARYWSTGEVTDVAWEYPEPLPGREDIAGLLSFDDRKVNVSVD